MRKTVPVSWNCVEMFSNKLVPVSRALLLRIKVAGPAHPSIRNVSIDFTPLRRITLTKSIAVGAGIGIGYGFYNTLSAPAVGDNKIHQQSGFFIIDHVPDVPIARKIVNANDKSNLNLVLFQYETCPFCCKVRAFLDANGFSYSVVEVDTLLKKRMKWSPYKKVPCLLMRKKDGRYLQLTESSMIISALATYLADPSIDIEELAKFYPKQSYVGFADGKPKEVISNKYFVMYAEHNKPKNITDAQLR